MGRRGPKQDAKVVQLRGETRPSRTSQARKPTTARLVRPTRRLSRRGRTVWDRCVPELEEAGIVDATDEDLLVAWCEAVSRHDKVTAQIERDGLMTVGSQGQSVANPLLAVASRAAADMVRLADKLGITPDARAALTPPEAKANEVNQRFFGRPG